MNTPYNSPFEAQFDPDRAQEFIILALLRATINTAELVRVQAVMPTSDRVGFVTVQPLVLDADTNNLVLAQTPIYNVPYMRMQGGSSAIVLDPVVGDIGVAIYAQRDITTLKATLQEAPAPTARAFSTADGLYMGGFLNAAPTQFVQFLAGGAGINITTPGNINLSAPAGNITLAAGEALTLQSTGNTTVGAAAFIVNAPTTFNGTVSGTATGAGSYTFASPLTAPDVILPAGAVNTHIHGGVLTGANNTHTMNT